MAKPKPPPATEVIVARFIAQAAGSNWPLQAWIDHNPSYFAHVIDNVLHPKPKTIQQQLGDIRRGIAAARADMPKMHGYSEDDVFSRTCKAMVAVQKRIANEDPTWREREFARVVDHELERLKTDVARVVKVYEDVRWMLEQAEKWANEDLSHHLYDEKRLEDLLRSGVSRLGTLRDHASDPRAKDPGIAHLGGIDRDVHDPKLAADLKRVIALEERLQARVEAKLAEFRGTGDAIAAAKAQLQERLPDGWTVTTFKPSGDEPKVEITGPEGKHVTVTRSSSRPSFFAVGGTGIGPSGTPAKAFPTALTEAVDRVKWINNQIRERESAAKRQAAEEAAAERALATAGTLPLAPAEPLPRSAAYLESVMGKAGVSTASVVTAFGEDLLWSDVGLLRLGPAGSARPSKLRVEVNFARTALAQSLLNGQFTVINFGSALATAAEFCAQDDHRFGLNGVHIATDPPSVGGLKAPPAALVAVDGHRLYSEAVEPVQGAGGKMIPRIVAADPKSDGIVAMTPDGLVWLSRGVITHTPEGWRDFLQYKQIIPPWKQGKQAPTVMTPAQARALKDELTKNLKGWKRNLLTWTGHEMALVARADAPDPPKRGKPAKPERVPASSRSFRSPVEGPDYLLGINVHYLRDALATFKGNSPVTIQWPDHPLQPIPFIQGSGVWQRFHVIMPHRTD